MSEKVEKALSPEEGALLGNIKTLIGELEAMSGGGEEAPVEPPVVEEEVLAAEDGVEEERGMVAPEEEEVTVKGKVVKEADTNSPSDGATASDDTEERIDAPQTELSQEAQDKAVAKALQNIVLAATGKKEVAPINPVIKSIDGMAKILKANLEIGNANSTAIKHLLDANGITKEMEIAEKSLQAKKEPVVTGTSAQQVVDLVNLLTKAAGGGSEPSNEYKGGSKHPSAEVNKKLGDPNVLKALLGYKQ